MRSHGSRLLIWRCGSVSVAAGSGIRDSHRAGSACATPDPQQNVLRLLSGICQRRTQYACLPRLPGTSRRIAGHQPRGDRRRHADRHRAWIATSRLSASLTGRTTSIPICPRAIKSASTICRSASAGFSNSKAAEKRFGPALPAFIMEEDTGRLVHRTEADGREVSLVDLESLGSSVDGDRG